MGVAGSGKSTVASGIAKSLGCQMIEGDDFHSSENRRKMAEGVPLTDSDRAGWLESLGRELASHPDGAVLSCSALKRAYRDTLRRASPGLRFVYLQISHENARLRIEERANRHFFPESLVESQFKALEPPVDEPDVLTVDAMAKLDKIILDVLSAVDG